MGVRILADGQYACFWDDTTDWTFGPVFYDGEYEAEAFLKWHQGKYGDPRSASQQELIKREAEFKGMDEFYDKYGFKNEAKQQYDSSDDAVSDLKSKGYNPTYADMRPAGKYGDKPKEGTDGENYGIWRGPDGKKAKLQGNTVIFDEAVSLIASNEHGADEVVQSLMSKGSGVREALRGVDPNLKMEAPLYVIADEIEGDWKNVNFAARPYLDAMKTLDSIDDSYGQDSGRSIVAYFLSNASSWRGDIAREVKKELKAMLK